MSNSDFNPHDFKALFPLFKQPENEKLVYFDNAATTQKPQSVLDRLQHFYLHENANAHRASHRLARAATDAIEAARRKAAGFVGSSEKEIIFCRGATEGFNMLAYSLAGQCNAGEEIIITSAEHHANILPWRRLAQDKNMTIKLVPDRDGIPDLHRLPALLNEKTRIVSLTMASNVLGCKLDLLSVADVLRQHSCFYIVDAAQGLAHCPIDVKTLGCDFLIASAHKAYGPLGVGFIYGQQATLDSLDPYLLGGEMVRSVTLDSATFADAPGRFEAGTMQLSSIAGFAAALDCLQQQNRTAMHQHEIHLIHYLHQALAAMPEIRLISKAENNIGICTFNIESDRIQASVADLAEWLDEHDIAVRVGYHCAQPLYVSRNLLQGLRISIAGYNTLEDCDKILNAIRAWIDEHQRKHKPLQSDSFLDALQNAKNWQARYKMLMELGLQPRDESIQSEHTLIHGCEAKTWLKGKTHNGVYEFVTDSESRVIRGLGILLQLWFNGHTAEHIQSFPWEEECRNLGLTRHLSASRNNGFRALIFTAQVFATSSDSG